MNKEYTEGEAPLRGVLCRVGTPAEPDAITGYPRILISTDEQSVMAVKRLPILKPVVVIEESVYAADKARIEALTEGLRKAEASLENVDRHVGLLGGEQATLKVIRQLLTPRPEGVDSKEGKK